MKKYLLPLLLLIYILGSLQAQDLNFNKQDFRLDENLGPHIHLHEKGYYYVTEEFMNPIGNRNSKPVLDSIKFVQISSNGDTIASGFTIYMISNENRLLRTINIPYGPNPFGNVVKTSTEYFYEPIEAGMIQYDTTYTHLENDEKVYRSNRVSTINSKGFITDSFQEVYNNGLWVNNSMSIWEFNDFDCLLSRITFNWNGIEFIPFISYINECDEDLLISETYNSYNTQDSTTVPIRSLEFQYNDSKKLVKETSYRPTFDDPLNLKLNSVRTFTYNEFNLLDTIAASTWDPDFEEFYNTGITIYFYDEFLNVSETKSYSYDAFNNLYLSSYSESIYDNNYFQGEFLSAGITSTTGSKTMLLRNTGYSSGEIRADNQYFYSTPSVSSTEKKKNYDFELYPNPTKNEVFINVSDNLNKDSRIILRNINGALELTRNAENTMNFNVGHLPSGIYFLNIESSTSRSEIKKLIIQ